MKWLIPSRNDRELTKLWPLVRRINEIEAGLQKLSDDELRQKTAEWKEEIVYLNQAPTGPREAVFPDGRKVQIPPEDDPRRVFADWLTEPNNQWFARNITNRVWAWLMGRGIINEPDDIRPDNPPVNPELLAFLEKELVRSKYNLKHIYRLILNSRT